MAYRLLLLNVVGGMLLVNASASEVAQAPGKREVTEVVDGLLARSEAIKSGRMKYKVLSNISPGYFSSFVFAMSGSSWRVDDLRNDITCVSHRGAFIEVHRTPQPAGPPRNSAKFGSEKPIDYRNPFPPYFASSFWYRGKHATADYIRLHKNDGIFAGQADVNGIKCDILDWPVSRADRYKAFNVIIPSLDAGGILRVYVSRDLGYVLPRIDYVSAMNVLAIRFDASEFRDVGRGIFVPMKIIKQTFPDNGEKGYRLEYEVESATDINKSIADAEFGVDLPPDTSVTNVR